MENGSGAHEKLKHLSEIIKEQKRVAVAFSGGVDSAFLLKAALDVLGTGGVLAITAGSSIHPKRETDHAAALAHSLGARHMLMETDELSIPEFVRNPKNRCYICKRSLFWKMKEKAESLGILSILEGSNTDDLLDFRPGMRALKELGIKSPLLEAGLKKSEIRLLSREMGLETWDKQPFACLATRFPYGERITTEKIAMVESCEQYLLNLGFRQVRVRHHGDIARIEVGKDETARLFRDGLSEMVDAECRRAGFTYCTIDLKGYRTGSMNQAAAREETHEQG